MTDDMTPPLQFCTSHSAYPLVVLVSFVLYVCIYSISCKYFDAVMPKDSQYHQLQASRIGWNSRVVSNVNIAVSIVGALHTLLFEDAGWTSLLQPYAASFESSCSRDYYLLLVGSYLLYDLILCLYFKEVLGDPLVYAHHVVILLAFLGGVISRRGTFYMSLLLWNEVSTIFLNRRYFMLVGVSRAESEAVSSSVAYVVNGSLLFATFFLFRVVVVTAALLHIGWSWVSLWAMVTKFTPSTTLFLGGLSLLALGHAVLNYVWFIKIYIGFRRGISRVTGARENADNPSKKVN